MNRRGFLQMVGAALVVPHIPKRVYSFIRRSDSLYLQNLIDAGAGGVVRISGSFEIDRPLSVPPHTHLEMSGSVIHVMDECSPAIDGRRGRNSTVSGGTFDYRHANIRETLVRETVWTGGLYQGTLFRHS